MSIVLLLVVALIIFFIIRSKVREKRSGKGCGCAGCSGCAAKNKKCQ
ncbi:MAG TPA: FeoB-associated Cys-rich membrane protein [Ruminococcus sp.]|nr:FeoB-associated Cys-rich membrane protein [Ruminococcus sp.]